MDDIREEDNGDLSLFPMGPGFTRVISRYTYVVNCLKGRYILIFRVMVLNSLIYSTALYFSWFNFIILLP